MPSFDEASASPDVKVTKYSPLVLDENESDHPCFGISVEK